MDVPFATSTQFKAPISQTLHPSPFTLNPKPFPLNPKPQMCPQACLSNASACLLQLKEWGDAEEHAGAALELSDGNHNKARYPKRNGLV